jgi:hypothetical protein
MPQIYITQAEAYILSFFDGGKFEAEHRQLHHDYTMPKVVRAIRDQYGYDDGIDLLDYVIHRVEIRQQHAKDRRNRSEIGTYLCFLMKSKGLLERLKEDAAQKPPKTFMHSIIDFYRGRPTTAL